MFAAGRTDTVQKIWATCTIQTNDDGHTKQSQATRHCISLRTIISTSDPLSVQFSTLCLCHCLQSAPCCSMHVRLAITACYIS